MHVQFYQIPLSYYHVPSIGLNTEYMCVFFWNQESLGYVDINLSDVVSNKRINEKYHLIDSKNGRIQIELQWRTSA